MGLEENGDISEGKYPDANLDETSTSKPNDGEDEIVTELSVDQESKEVSSKQYKLDTKNLMNDLANEILIGSNSTIKSYFVKAIIILAAVAAAYGLKYFMG